MIDGFDLGNSPRDYSPERVSGKTIIFTTSNGTQALARCRQASRVYLAGFVNASAVCRRLMDAERIHLICAGTRGEFSRDDILLAGLIVETLASRSGESYVLNAQAITARENWRQAFPLPCALGAEPIPVDRLVECLRGNARWAACGGRRLRTGHLGRRAQVDQFDIVPELDPTTFVIELPSRSLGSPGTAPAGLAVDSADRTAGRQFRCRIGDRCGE